MKRGRLGVSGFFALTLVLAKPGCALEPADNGESVDKDRPTVAMDVKEGRITAKPLRVVLKPKADLASRIRAVAEGERGITLRLSVEGLDPPDAPVGIRVYLGSDPKKELPGTDSPHFVGTLGFFRNKDEDRDEPEEGTKEKKFVDLAGSIRRLQKKKLFDPDGPIAITLVVVPVRPGADIDGIAIPVRRVRLTAIDTRKE
jgi:hypothetical protein